jgi:hypothetical protein
MKTKENSFTEAVLKRATFENVDGNSPIFEKGRHNAFHQLRPLIAKLAEELETAHEALVLIDFLKEGHECDYIERAMRLSWEARLRVEHFMKTMGATNV